MKTEFAIILNPAGGGGKAIRRWKELESALQAKGIPFKLYESKYDRHAIELTKIAVNDGFTHLIGVGGDGTMSHIANGILALEESKRQGIAMTLFSSGTGNDWVRTHAIPTDVNSFISRLVNIQYHYQDAAKITLQGPNTKELFYAMNVVGLAYDAFVVKKSNNRKSTNWSGKFYLFHVLRSLFDYSPEHIAIQSAENSLSAKLYTINIGICSYSGGKMKLVPHADHNDNLLAITAIGAIPKWEVVLRTPMFYNGKIGRHRASKLWQSNKVEIFSESEQQTGIEADGDYIGQTPALIESISNAIRIFGM